MPRPHPHIYEINTRVWLRRLGAPGLAAVPETLWSGLAAGIDYLWLMGLWRRSPAARAQALSNADLLRAYGQALPDWGSADVEASPYAVHGYEIEPSLGRPEHLAALHRHLEELGVGLIVDFVPNHLAIDHPWTIAHPQRFVTAGPHELHVHPDRFFATADGTVLAHGRDPYFPPWTDTVQVNFFSPEMREAMIGELLAIARVADGVRCDMAMLGLNEVFERTWGEQLHANGIARPATEFWAEATQRVKAARPDFIFIAEAYWSLEGRLLELGFDYAYDKHWYDLMLGAPAAEIRHHLAHAGPLLDRGVRFLENHDERRAAAALGPHRGAAAAVALMTLPGMRLLHDGQLEGRHVRLPVQLAREPLEQDDTAVSALYRRLLAIADDDILHRGRWSLLDPAPVDADDGSWRDVLAWSWHSDGRTLLVVINMSAAPARVALPGMVALDSWRDLLNEGARAGPAADGTLLLELEPWMGRVMEG